MTASITRTRNSAVAWTAAAILLLSIAVGIVAAYPADPVPDIAVMSALTGIGCAALALIRALTWMLRAGRRRHRLARFELARDEGFARVEGLIR